MSAVSQKDQVRKWDQKYTIVSGKGKEDYYLLQLDKVPQIKGYRNERMKR